MLCAWAVAASAAQGSTPPPTSAPAAEPAAAASQPATTQPSEPQWPFVDRLTGDWLGGRTWLEDNGLSLSVSLTTVYQHNAHGGLNTHKAHDIMGSSDIELTLDLEKMKLLPGGQIYMLGESSWGRGIGADVGDLFGTDFDAAGDRAFDVTELWYEQTLLEGKARFRIGKIDPMVDFDTNAYANDETAQFLNGALVVNPTIPWADRGLGMQLFIKPTDWLYAGALVMDANGDFRETGFRTTFHGPDHLFSMYEFGLTPVWHTQRGDLPGSYRLGLWYDPQPKEQFFNDLGGRIRTAPIRTDDLGFYASFDQLLWKENAEMPEDLQGLGMFFRYGYAPGDVNTIQNFWSVGGQYQGPIPTRDNDVIGFGVAQGLLSHHLEQTGVSPQRETALELYYKIEVFPWLAISPDFQWVLDPGGLGARDSFVAGLRVQASF